ncbi:MAG TPA: universal stress protein [Nitrospira sp.]|nr:universal stress protein [Nitrospira sp.]
MRIICAVDGSEYSTWGVETLKAIAGREPEHVTLIHVIDTTSFKTAETKTVSADKRAVKAMEKAGQLILRNAERSAKVALGQASTGPRTALHRVLTYGPIATTIVQQARRGKADLILIGSRGLSDIKGFLLGSISRRVASMAPCSVLVVKEPLSALRRITLAVDDSKPSRIAAQFLRSELLPDSATVTILSSAESPVSDLGARYLSAAQLSDLMQPVIERATRLVNSFRADFVKDGMAVTTKVQMDHVIDTIIKHVESDHTDLLVAGARRLSKSERIYLGSVSETLLRHAPCSVLIARRTHGASLR